MIDHLPDLDADFLAVYGIDLADPDCDIPAELFFTRAWRLFHRESSMRAHLEAEQAEQERGEGSGVRPVQPAPSPQVHGAAAEQVDADGTRWVSPDQMKQLFPDLF